MSKYHIRPMELNELKDFFKRIKQDFVQGEYAPYAILYKHFQNGLLNGLVFCEGKQDLAYSICEDNHDNGYVLISLLAVFKEYRDQGIGSAFIKRLRLMYRDKQALLVEVERPDQTKTKEEGHSRRRRIDFYEKAGFYLIQGIDYSIWDISMHLMALPIVSSKEIIDQKIEKSMYELYFNLMGEEFIHKMQFMS